MITKKNNIYDPKNISSGIPLLPFTNQVGGHTSIFRFSKKTICKPASVREQQVYSFFDSHHPELLPFLSQYLGVLNVTYHQKNEHQLLPEVIFEKNEKLMDDWNSIYSVDDLTTPSPSSDILEKDFQQWSPNEEECNSRFKAFRRRVLYEALNPNALQERMQVVNALNEKNKENTTDDSNTNSGIERMTVLSKRPSIIKTTTSAPQSPRLLTALSRNAECNSEDSRTGSSPAVPKLDTKAIYCSSPLSTARDNTIDTSPLPSQHHSSSNTSTSSARWQPRRAPTNPWSQQVYEKDRQRLLQLSSEKDDVVKQFILLEDLTDEVVHPCVLDLKMGTRQHGVYAKQSKVVSQTEKCANSTSAAMGVRICGMQVYKEDDFVFYDKYHGRNLTPLGFKQSLKEYLNGQKQLLEHLPVLLRKLSRLSKIITALKGYRFYGSSLLVIYDASGNKKKIDVRMIDFAKSLTPDQDSSEFTCPPEKPNDPDHGYLLGLKTLIDCFSDIYDEYRGA